MILAKYGTPIVVPFGPVLAADGTMSSGALAYTDAKIFKNGTDGALNASATFTHKYEGVYALLLKAADLDAVGDYDVVLNKNPLSAAPVKLTVLAANVYDWLFGTAAPNTVTPDAAGVVAAILGNATYGLAALLTAIQAELPGSGIYTKVYTVTNSSTGLPIAGVNVRVTTDVAGFNTVAMGTTDSSGQVTFYLDAGTYYLWRTHSLYGFANPDTEVAP